MEVITIKLDQIVQPDSNIIPYRVRNKGEVAVLARSISENGLLQAIAVRRRKDGTYETVGGRGREAAFRLLHECLVEGYVSPELTIKLTDIVDRHNKYSEIPAHVVEFESDYHVFKSSVDENMARHDLHPLDEARWFLQLKSDHMEGKFPVRDRDDELDSFADYCAKMYGKSTARTNKRRFLVKQYV